MLLSICPVTITLKAMILCNTDFKYFITITIIIKMYVYIKYDYNLNTTD